MAHININLNEINDEETHPTGMTHLRIVGGETKQNADKSGDHIAWKCEVVGSALKRPVYFNSSLKPDSQGGLKRLLKACKFQWNSDGTFDTKDVIGSEFQANLGVEEWNGSMRNTVNFPYKAV